MAEIERVRVTCDQRGCHASAWWPARGWSQHRGLDFCRRHTAVRAARHACPADHRHATSSTCYSVHACRCDDCTAEHTRREAARTKAKAYGRWQSPYVSADPVRAHVERLRAQGMGLRTIAQRSGISLTSIAALVRGRQGGADDPRSGQQLQRVLRRNADRILALEATPHTLAAHALTPSRGAHRRIQALVARGWSIAKLADALSMGRSNLCTVLHAEHITLAMHDRISTLYDRLWNIAPPRQAARDAASYTRARNFAEAHGWLPPLAWDDIDADDEPPTPDNDEDDVDQLAVETAIEGLHPRLRTVERHAAVTILHSRRWSDRRIAEWLDVTQRTVERDRQLLSLDAYPQAELLKAS